MKDLLLPLLHLAVTAAKLCRPGGVRAVIAENLLLKQQLIVLRRSRQRAPNLRVGDRLLCGFGALVNLLRCASIVLQSYWVTRRQSLTETRSNGFDSRRLHRYRALQSVPHPTRWQEITQSARADLDWPTTRLHEWDTRTSASQIRCSTSAATRTRISPSSNSPRSRQRWVRHQVLSQESASMSLSPLDSRAALVSELVDIHVRNCG